MAEAMIDRVSRDVLANLISSAKAGRIRSFEFEDLLLDLNLGSEDPVVAAFKATLHDIVDEQDGFLTSVLDHPESRARVARWISFLKSDIEYRWPATRLPVGFLDTYRPTWFDKLLGKDVKIQHEIDLICQSGDYRVWPYFNMAECGSGQECS